MSTDPFHDDQLTRLMERSMGSVSAGDDLVAGGIARGRRLTRRRRTVQAVGLGAAAALVTAAAVTAPAVLGGADDDRLVAADPAPTQPTTDPAPQPTPQPTSGPTDSADTLPPYLQRAQALILDALPQPIPDPGYAASVDFDPDGRGAGEVLALLSTDAAEIVDLQDARCDRVATSPAPDDCVDTGEGWVFTGASLPDVSGRDPELEGLQALYILRSGKTVNLTAYNALRANRGGAPTRPDPVLDIDDLTALVTQTEWFA